MTGTTIPDPHARVFAPWNRYWSPNGQNNRIFLLTQQNYFNDLLKSRGHVFLNEVFDGLGFNRTSEGQLVGWLKDNGLIDFQMTEGEFEEGTFSLDFNVNDGVIYDKI